MVTSVKPFEIKKRCYQFSLELIKFIEQTKYDKIYFSIFDQLLRSGTSIGANAVEGAALKSANETKYWLCLIRDAIKCDMENVKDLITEADELSKIIASCVLKMKTA